MDQIYNDATVTIIAAAGADAEFGLPGVSHVSRRGQMSVDIGERRFLVFPDSTEEVWHSISSKRAWTYQEGLLSRRRLLFTESQVYFQCMKMHCWEGLAAPPAALQHMRFYQVFPEDGIGRSGVDIVKRLNEYASRQLTFESDALNAFLGIFRPYQRKDVFHFWGIPFLARTDTNIDRNFGVALGWITRLPDRAQRRRAFPSWTWVGWQHLDNVPWGPEAQEADISVRVVHRSEEVVSLSEYVDRVRAGADFTEFLPSIVMTGWASKCRVISAWEVKLDPPLPWMGAGVFVVRMMAMSEQSYGVLEEPLDIIYLGCQQSSSLFFSYLIIQGRNDGGSYVRVGTLSVMVHPFHLGKDDNRMGTLNTAVHGGLNRRRLHEAEPSDFSSRKRFQQAPKHDILEFLRRRWELKVFRLM
ncbi:hypothetical protein DL771_009773 [Monosporascus sp. 5C6A]|nr:hypothetical protein DL771_009773 [Monosporascus sp. 5C6A]